jgi:hypothetical protein
MPLRQARSRELHYARGIKGPKFLVDGPDGKLFTVPDAAVWALCELDREGAFDDPPPGNAVRLTGCELLAAIAGEALASVFAPLFPPSCLLCPRVRPRSSLSASFSRPDDRRLTCACRRGSVRCRSAPRPPGTSGSAASAAATIGHPGSGQRTPRGPEPLRSQRSRSNGGTPTARRRRASPAADHGHQLLSCTYK